MYRKLFVLSGLFLQAFSVAKAQEGNIVPAMFDQFFNNFYLVNPANEDSIPSFRARAGNRSLTGLFQGVNRIYFDADVAVRTNRSDRFHAIGIQAVNSREGEFFSKSRLYGRYSWRTGISPRSALSMGVSLGMVNYAFGSSQASAGGSALALDGNTGIWYLRERWKAGFSMQQIFGQRLQPVNQVFTLNRFYNFNISAFFPLGVHLALSNHFYSRWQPQHPVNMEFASLFEIQQKVQAGFNYRHNNGIAFMAGIKKIGLGSSLRISFMASYIARSRNISRLTDNAVEFSLSLEK